MIRDVGEDPLSPALRDIERERGARTALDKRWLRLLCLVCWCRGEALKVKKRPLRLSSRNECCPSSIFKPSLGRREIYLSPLSGIRKRNIIFIKAHVQEIRIQNNRIKINNGKSFFFSFGNIFRNTKFADHRVFFAGGNLLRNETKGGKMSSREKSSEVI